LGRNDDGSDIDSTTLPTPNITERHFEQTILFCIGVALLYIGQSLLIPLALAILLTFLLSPSVTKLRQIGLPKSLSVASITLLTFSIMLFLGLSIGRQITVFAEDLPRYKITLADKIQTLKTLSLAGPAMERASDTLRSLRKEIEKNPQAAPQQTPETTSPTKVTIDQPSTPLEQLKQTIDILGPPLIVIGIVIIFVVVLLFYREDVRDRVIRLLGVSDLARTTRALDDAGQRLNRYFVAITAINTLFGLVIGIGLWLIGIPNPLLWALFAALLRFVPFIGVPIAALLPLLLAVVVDPGWSMLAYTLALFIVSEIFVSQVVETIVQGEATGLSPLAIIVATTFWTLLWGPVGLVLAVPLTVMLVVLGRHTEQFAVFDILLGAAPALTPSDRFYQRILAGDPDEAADQAETQLKEMSLEAYYDTVVLDGLKKAINDIETGKIDPTRVVRIKESLDSFIETTLELSEELHATNEQFDTNKPSATTIYCIGARSKLDDIAAGMLAQLLKKRNAQAEFLTTPQLLENDVLNPLIICLSAFDIGKRGAHTKFLIKRLHRRFPHVTFVGCFWRLPLNHDNTEVPQLGPLKPNDLVNTLSAAVDLCILHLNAERSSNKTTADRELT
jgi:predicted PurR-regulated permease PerM